MRFFISVLELSPLLAIAVFCSMGWDVCFPSKIELFAWEILGAGGSYSSLAQAHVAPGRARGAFVLAQPGCSFLPPVLTDGCSCRVGWVEGPILLKANTPSDRGRELCASPARSM